MEKILTPEIILIALVMVAIVMGFFFMLVANKISAIDHKMTELTEGMDRRVNHSINTLSDQLHDDVVTRSKAMENSLSQMGDTWRNSLNKTVEDVRSEIGKLQSEITHSNEEMNKSLGSNFLDHAADVNENLAMVRDNHHREVQSYHEQLANQVREHAVTEQATLHNTLNSISEAVKSNLTTLSESQSQKMLDVASEFTTGYTKINDQVDATIKAVTSKVENDFSSITAKVDKTISHFDKMVKEDLSATGTEVSTNLSNIKTKLDNSVSGITSKVTKNLDSLTSEINTKMLNSTEKLEQGLSDTAAKLDTSIDNVTTKLDTSLSDTTTKLDTNIDNVTTKVDTQLTDLSEKLDLNVGKMNNSVRDGIENLSTSVTVNFDAIESKLNRRIHKELQGLVDVFRGFSSKVDVIEETQDRIERLAENVGVLSQALDDRRSRGNMGEVLVESIVSDNMTPRDYELNAELSNGTVVDCLLRLPKPSGNIAITTKIDISDLEVISSPLANKKELEQARTSFAINLEQAIEKTSHDCIIEDETAEGAVLLLPSESAFSEAHINHRQLVDLGYRNRVWLASPSTLVAIITVARSVIKDANARQEMNVVHTELQVIVSDYKQLGQEMHNLTRDIEAVQDSASNTRRSVRNVSERLLAMNDKLTNSPELIHSKRPS